MANEFDWLKYGKDYGEVNKNLNGLPGFFQEIGRRWKENKGGPIERLLGVGEDPTLMAGQKYFVNPVSAGVTGGANMALGGLPSAVAGKIAPQYAARQAATRAEHPIATGIGQGAGLAGAVLAPTAAGVASKAIGAIGPTLQLGPAGAKLGTTLARNALLSSAYAVPAAGAEAISTGNIGAAAKKGAFNLALGTGIGTLAEKLSPLLTKLQLRGAGVQTRDIAKTTAARARASGVGPRGRQGFQIKNTESVEETAAKLLQKYGAGRGGKEAAVKAVSEGYEQLGKLYDKAGVKMTDMLDELASDSTIREAVKIYGQQAVDDAILELAPMVDKLPWRRAYSGILRDIQTRGGQADPLSKLATQGAVAQVIRGKMAQVADNLRLAAGRADIPAIETLNSIQDATKAIGAGLNREIGVIPGLTAGSPTAEKGMLMPGVKEAIAGGVMGAGAAGATGRPKRPEDIIPYVLRVAGGGVAGGALSRMAASGVNRALFPVATGLKAALPAIKAIGQPLAAMGGATGAGAQGTPLGKAMQGLPESPPQPSAETTPAEAAEAQAGPQGTEEAKQETNAAFRDRVIGELQKAWGGLQAAGTRMSFEEFTTLVGQYTNDFDPKMAAPILFPDPEERERYLKTYEQALALKSLDVPGAFGSMRYFDPERDKNILAKRSLQNWMAGLLGGPEKMADPRLAELVEKDVEAIRRLRLPVAEKEAALRKLLQVNYGIDFDMLNQYGVGV